MTCAQFRQAASARLDGEPVGLPVRTLDDHLETCPDCGPWHEAAVRLMRSTRVGLAHVPDLSARILATTTLPSAPRRWPSRAARIVLAVTGAVQLAVAIPGVLGASIDMHVGSHGAHEAAAWNLALAIALMSASLAPRRAAGMIPLLAAFVVTLGVLSIRDIAAGEVAAGRLLTHVGAVIGLGAAWVLRREAGRPRPSPVRDAAGRGAVPDASAGMDESAKAGHPTGRPRRVA